MREAAKPCEQSKVTQLVSGRKKKTQAAWIGVGTVGFLCSVLSSKCSHAMTHVLIEKLQQSEAFQSWCAMEEGTLVKNLDTWIWILNLSLGVCF